LIQNKYEEMSVKQHQLSSETYEGIEYHNFVSTARLN